MIRQTKKLFLGLLSLGAIFVIAGCGQNQASDQNANNAQQSQRSQQAQQAQKDPNNLAGEWESVYELDSLQKAFFPRGMNSYTYAKFLEAFKDFKMKLSVDGTNATLSYQYDSKKFAKAFYEI